VRYRPQVTKGGTRGQSGTGHKSLRAVQGVGAVQATRHCRNAGNCLFKMLENKSSMFSNLTVDLAS